MNKILMATGMMVGYAYGIEFFIAWYSGNPYERFVFINRALGPYSWAYWTMVTCNVLVPQLFWFEQAPSQPARHLDHLDLREHRHVVRAFRDHRTSLHRDFLPSSWGYSFTRPGSTSRSSRHHRHLPVAVPAVRQVHSRAGHFGSEGHPARRAAFPSRHALRRTRMQPIVGPPASSPIPTSAGRRAPAARAGYRKFDFHTPYPLHGLDDAMGVKRTILPWISLGGGLAGLAVATHLQWWTGAVDYPLIIGGKPLFAFEPSVPIMFELTVLVSAIATVVGMFALNGLPKWFSRWQHDAHFTRRWTTPSSSRSMRRIPSSSGEDAALLSNARRRTRTNRGTP
jgi:hypothetical protein